MLNNIIHPHKKIRGTLYLSLFKSSGLVHSLASRFCLLLAFYAGLFVSLSLTQVADNAVSCTLTLKSSDCAVQRFVFTYFNCRHIIASFP